MKKILMILLAMALIVSLTACSEEKPDESASVESLEKTTGTGGEASQSTTSAAKDADDVIIQISGSIENPDLKALVTQSEVIVSGEVIAEAEPVHTNPDGTLVNCYGSRIKPAMKYQYSVRVNEVFLGDVQPGDIVTVNLFNDYGIPYDNTGLVKVRTDFTNYYLTVGEENFFFLYFFDGRTAIEDPTPENTGYEATKWGNGIFCEDEDGIWQSLPARNDNSFRAEDLPGIIAEYRDGE